MKPLSHVILLIFVVLLLAACESPGEVAQEVSTETIGGVETAVSTYLTLIQQAPNSPWSWLAWARLAPIENN